MMEHMDRIFWTRFGNEYHSDPQAPKMACFGGMFFVAIVFFFLFAALLAPMSRLAIIVTNHFGTMNILATGERKLWSKGILTLAAVGAISVVVRRYWRYHLTPEISLPYREKFDRAEMSVMWACYTAGACALMAIMYKVFWYSGW